MPLFVDPFKAHLLHKLEKKLTSVLIPLVHKLEKKLSTWRALMLGVSPNLPWWAWHPRSPSCCVDLRARWLWLQCTNPLRRWHLLHLPVTLNVQEIFHASTFWSLGDGNTCHFWTDRRQVHLRACTAYFRPCSTSAAEILFCSGRSPPPLLGPRHPGRARSCVHGAIHRAMGPSLSLPALWRP